MQSSFVTVSTSTNTSSRASIFWSGIVSLCLGAFLVHSAVAALPVFDHAWSVVLLGASPLLGVVWLVDSFGVGLAFDSWRSSVIGLAGGSALCLIGGSLLVCDRVRDRSVGAVGNPASSPSDRCPGPGRGQPGGE
jgi:hypothetical protein